MGSGTQSKCYDGIVLENEELYVNSSVPIVNSKQNFMIFYFFVFAFANGIQLTLAP